jgi:hypothetical protein
VLLVGEMRVKQAPGEIYIPHVRSIHLMPRTKVDNWIWQLTNADPVGVAKGVLCDMSLFPERQLDGHAIVA